MRRTKGQSQPAYTFSTTCLRSDASDTLAAIRTISSSTIRQGVGLQVEGKTATRRASSGPWSTVGEGPRQEFLRGGPRSRKSTGSTKITAFRGSILGGSDQAYSRLSFVVPLLELILSDLALIEIRPRHWVSLVAVARKHQTQSRMPSSFLSD